MYYNKFMKVFPVVHIQDTEQAREQTDIAFESGADGVYLISHSSGVSPAVLKAFEAVKKDHEDDYIGINLLAGRPDTSFNIISRALAHEAIHTAPDALWVDEATHSLEDIHALLDANILRQSSAELKGVRFLGGVAFKYTRLYTDNPRHAASAAHMLQDYMDVVTTSGQGTGYAPSPAKIAAIKEVIDKPLAVASGVSLQNIGDYGNNIDEVLVASSVETVPYSGIFDKSKLVEFIDTAKSL